MKLWLLLLAIVAVTLSVVLLQISRSQAERRVLHVTEPSKALEQAVAEAQRTLPQFMKRLENPRPDDKAFAIQARFAGVNGVAEHIWVNHLTLDHGKIRGTLAEVPYALTEVKKGDAVGVAPKNVSDWIILRRDGSKEGNFAETALREIRSK